MKWVVTKRRNDRTAAPTIVSQIIRRTGVSLLGTGLATVALGLLAFDLAGPKAGTVLGTALANKMIAYVGVAPVAQAVFGSDFR